MLSGEFFLQKFHLKFPSCTSHGFSLGRAVNGFSSYDFIVESLKKYKGPLLDMACGDGYLLKLIAEARQENSWLYGLDMSEGELQRAWQQKILRAHQILKGNARELPFSPQSMQSITCHMAFMLMPKVNEIIDEIYRVLQTKGLFVAVIPAEPVMDDVLSEYKSWLKKNIDPIKLAELQDLGDYRVNDVESLKVLFQKFEKFEIEKQEIIYDLTPEQMAFYFTLFYASGLLSDQQLKKMESDLFVSFQKMKQTTVRHIFPIYILKATK